MEPGAEFNMQHLLEQAMRMNEQLAQVQQQLAETEVQGTAGGGLVNVTMNGGGEVMELRIDPKAIDPGDPEETAETVSALVLAAIRDATRTIQKTQEEAMGPFTEGLGGEGFPGLPGLPGTPGA